MEDIYLEQMFGTSPAEDEVTLKAAKETFMFEGSEYVLYEMPQESLNKPAKRLWFHHGGSRLLHRAGARQLHQGFPGGET